MTFEELKGYWLFEKDFRLLNRFGLLRMSWSVSCPSVDIRSQIGWAHAWCVANPKKAPKKDYARFLNTWMVNEQKKATSPIKAPGWHTSLGREPVKRQLEYEKTYKEEMTFEEMQQIRQQNLGDKHKGVSNG